MALSRRGKPCLYTAGYGSAESALILCEFPRGESGKARPREATARFHSVFPSTPEGWFPVKGKTRSRLDFESRPGVYGRSLLPRRSAKSALGCLTYSRIWGLSRGKHNIL